MRCACQAVRSKHGSRRLGVVGGRAILDCVLPGKIGLGDPNIRIKACLGCGSSSGGPVQNLWAALGAVVPFVAQCTTGGTGRALVLECGKSVQIRMIDINNGGGLLYTLFGWTNRLSVQLLTCQQGGWRQSWGTRLTDQFVRILKHSYSWCKVSSVCTIGLTQHAPL